MISDTSLATNLSLPQYGYHFKPVHMLQFCPFNHLFFPPLCRRRSWPSGHLTRPTTSQRWRSSTFPSLKRSPSTTIFILLSHLIRYIYFCLFHVNLIPSTDLWFCLQYRVYYRFQHPVFLSWPFFILVEIICGQPIRRQVYVFPTEILSK